MHLQKIIRNYFFARVWSICCVFFERKQKPSTTGFFVKVYDSCYTHVFGSIVGVSTTSSTLCAAKIFLIILLSFLTTCWIGFASVGVVDCDEKLVVHQILWEMSSAGQAGSIITPSTVPSKSYCHQSVIEYCDVVRDIPPITSVPYVTMLLMST